MGLYRPRTSSERGFLGIITAQAICGTALEVAVLWKYLAWSTSPTWEVPNQASVPVNCGLAVFGFIYQLVLTFDALRVKNNVQVYSVCISNIVMLVFNVMRYGRTFIVLDGLRDAYSSLSGTLVDVSVDLWKIVSPLLITSSVIVGVCSVGLVAFGYKLHKEFAWAIYRHVSGSRQTRRRFLTYKVLVVLIKTEFYFFIAFITLYGIVDVHFKVPEFPLMVCLVPLALLQVALGIYFTKSENTLGAMVALVLRLAEIAYLISRIVYLRTGMMNNQIVMGNEMLLFAGVALAFTLLIFINSIVCILNFGYGLKPLLSFDEKSQRHEYEFQPLGHQSGHQSFVSHRFDLD